MIERDSTQSVPLAPPHYQLLSHPLVHNPSSNIYSDCQDILENAVGLLELFHNIELEENSNRGTLPPNAAGAFYCLIAMLKDTLNYVSQNLDDVWQKSEATQLVKQLRQSVFFKALQETAESDKTRTYSTMALFLGIPRADIEVFFALVEQSKTNSEDF